MSEVVDRFKPLFRPRTVAIVGASAKSTAQGNRFIRMLRQAGFAGPMEGFGDPGNDHPLDHQLPFLGDKALACRVDQIKVRTVRVSLRQRLPGGLNGNGEGASVVKRELDWLITQ